jgi:hypothetical protein
MNLEYVSGFPLRRQGFVDRIDCFVREWVFAGLGRIQAN